MCDGDEFEHEGTSKALATVLFMDVDRVLDRVPVGGPSSKRTVASKTETLFGLALNADYGKLSVLLRFEPRHHRFRRAQLEETDVQ